MLYLEAGETELKNDEIRVFRNNRIRSNVLKQHLH